MFLLNAISRVEQKQYLTGFCCDDGRILWCHCCHKHVERVGFMRLQVALILRARQKNTKTYDLTSPEKINLSTKPLRKAPHKWFLRSLKSVYTPEVWHSPWKLMVGRLLSHWVSVIFQWQTVKLQVGIGYHIQFPGETGWYGQQRWIRREIFVERYRYGLA